MKNADSSLIIISGLPGSGKSTCGRMISQDFRFTYVDYDTVIGSFMEDIYKRFYPGIAYDQFRAEWRNCTYEAFWNVVAENLRLGNIVAASAPLTKEHGEKTFFTGLREKYGLNISVLSIITELPSDILRKRIAERGEARDEQKLKEWDRYYNSLDKRRIWDPDREILFYPGKEEEMYEQVRDFLTAEK